LSDFLRPEFLSRVDEVIVFKPLSPEALREIAQLMLDEYKEPLAVKGIGITADTEALDLLCEKAKGGKFGARDLRRVIRKEIEDRIANLIISSVPLAKIDIKAENGEIVLKY
ncbi:MAG: ATP-dependent Clp protease ATP-binding subunit, partial [Oscillospiraceae bacterium]